MGIEAQPAAKWLVAQGYTAYVLSYRLPGEGWKDGAIVSLQDAQRALRIVCAREKQSAYWVFQQAAICLAWR